MPKLRPITPPIGRRSTVAARRPITPMIAPSSCISLYLKENMDAIRPQTCAHWHPISMVKCKSDPGIPCCPGFDVSARSLPNPQKENRAKIIQISEMQLFARNHSQTKDGCQGAKSDGVYRPRGISRTVRQEGGSRDIAAWHSGRISTAIGRFSSLFKIKGRMPRRVRSSAFALQKYSYQ